MVSREQKLGIVDRVILAIHGTPEEAIVILSILGLALGLIQACVLFATLNVPANVLTILLSIPLVIVLGLISLAFFHVVVISPFCKVRSWYKMKVSVLTTADPRMIIIRRLEKDIIDDITRLRLHRQIREKEKGNDVNF